MNAQNGAIGSPLAMNNSVILDTKFNQISFTFTTPANCAKFRFRLGTYGNSATMHTEYDGIYVCEGNVTPYHWVDKITIGSMAAEDVCYWKSLDAQNKLFNEMLNLTNMGIFTTLAANEALIRAKESEIVYNGNNITLNTSKQSIIF
jgi:hypothetical protein